jgi:hypothetical protein
VHDLHFDAEHHEIVGGDGTHIWITNLYAEWLAFPAEQRDTALQRVAQVISSKDDSTEEPLYPVRNRLLPAVRASLYFASTDLLASGGTGGPPPALPHSALGNAAAIGIGIDSTDSIRLVSTKDLDKWNVPFEGLEQIAIPNRDLLLLAGAKDSKALLAIAGRADVAADEPRPIHTIALCLRDARWTDCIPDATPEVRARFRELALRSWGMLYEEQKKPLQEKLGNRHRCERRARGARHGAVGPSHGGLRTSSEARWRHTRAVGDGRLVSVRGRAGAHVADSHFVYALNGQVIVESVLNGQCSLLTSAMMIWPTRGSWSPAVRR